LRFLAFFVKTTLKPWFLKPISTTWITEHSESAVLHQSGSGWYPKFNGDFQCKIFMKIQSVV